mmetsp:Transcript_42590/g.92793  ORF Transcript_42590/g.92793 Transcript_42590/m.92793 type:complete len:325 (+) Transcript_42590:166-1140(+)
MASQPPAFDTRMANIVGGLNGTGSPIWASERRWTDRETTSYGQENWNGRWVNDSHGAGRKGGQRRKVNQSSGPAEMPLWMMPQPEYPRQAEGLKDLLAQVAPQARIGDCRDGSLTAPLAPAAPVAPGFFHGEFHDGHYHVTPVGGSLGSALEPYPGPSSTEIGEVYSVPQETWQWDRKPVAELDERSLSTPWPNGASGSAPSNRPSNARERPEADEGDDEHAFLDRWKSLFSKGSPLMSGTAADPFKEDFRRREKEACVWKKREGHHRRYQERRRYRGGDSPRDDEQEAEAPSGWQPNPSRRAWEASSGSHSACAVDVSTTVMQ